MRIFIIILAAVFVVTAAFAQSPSASKKTIPSFVIGSEESEKPLTPRERAYWKCVLQHVKGQESTEALNVMMAACRALSRDK